MFFRRENLDCYRKEEGKMCSRQWNFLPLSARFLNFVEDRKISQSNRGYRTGEVKAAGYCAKQLIVSPVTGRATRCVPISIPWSLSSLAHRSMARYARSSTRTIDVNRVTPRLQLGDMQLVSASDLSNGSKGAEQGGEGEEEKKRRGDGLERRCTSSWCVRGMQPQVFSRKQCLCADTLMDSLSFFMQQSLLRESTKAAAATASRM